MIMMTICMIILTRHATGSIVTKYRIRKNIARTRISVIMPDDIVLTPPALRGPLIFSVPWTSPRPISSLSIK